MRDAPSLAIIRSRMRAFRSRAYDPEGSGVARPLIGDVELVGDAYEVARRSADALVIVTEWDVFRALDLTRIAATMHEPLLVDLRNIYSPVEAEQTRIALCTGGRRIVSAS